MILESDLLFWATLYYITLDRGQEVDNLLYTLYGL